MTARGNRSACKTSYNVWIVSTSKVIQLETWGKT